MEFNKEILFSLKDKGKNICVYCNGIAQLLKEFSPEDFSEFSPRLYYFWRENKRPIPLKIIIKLMEIKKIKAIDIDSFSVGSGNRIVFPEDKNLAFNYLLGLILGDGCLVCTKRGKKKSTYRLQISFAEKKDAEIIRKLIKQLFDVKSSLYFSSGCYNLCVYSKPLVMILNKKYEIPIGLKYALIKIPKLNSEWEENQIKSFLKGVFDSDGNSYNHRNKLCIQLRQKSESFIRELKRLFEKIDIKFRNPYKDGANNSWVLWSSKKELVDNFINKIIDFNPLPP